MKGSTVLNDPTQAGAIGKMARHLAGCGRFVQVLALALAAAVLSVSGRAQGKSQTCQGPDSCCPAVVADRLTTKASVQLGVLLVGLYAVDEKAGTWTADLYLSESWSPTAGFSPETEIANEVARQSEQFDTTVLTDGQCTRTRRIRSVLQNNFNLRRFPFDRHSLVIEFSDAWFSARDVGYAKEASVSSLDEAALTQLSSWKVEQGLKYSAYTRALREASGATSYEYAKFSLPVRRHLTFHLTKFFLPLFVIVAVAFGLFWIDPADIGTRVSVAVTCLLAAIAFQLAEAGSLGHVEYLTLADRVYATCYVSLALALLMAIYQNTLVRRGRTELAHKWDTRNRIGFPAAVVVAVAVAFTRAFTQVG